MSPSAFYSFTPSVQLATLVALQYQFLLDPIFPSCLPSLEVIMLLLAKCTNVYQYTIDICQ